MNLCKVGFFILSFVASYVDSDSLTKNGRKYYFNSCQCGEAVAEGYGFFHKIPNKYSIFTKKQDVKSKYTQLHMFTQLLFSGWRPG